ncbi:hypothetical protein JTB14_007430 [Gonioctena quinquepunctata]|nr:hypothetical protein JTB14_007430 [Gonioctena quinquepunctata]
MLTPKRLARVKKSKLCPNPRAKTRYVPAPPQEENAWDKRSRSHPGYQGERREKRKNNRIQPTAGSPEIPYTPPADPQDPLLFDSGGNDGFTDLMSNVNYLVWLIFQQSVILTKY